MQETLIGQGSTGLVFRKGHFAYKNASPAEAEIYRLLEGKPGIAPGFLQSDKIVTPFYPNVISVDTVPPEKRSSFASIVMSNIDRINRAVSSLTAVGYEYSDPLQFGLKNGRMFLLDFSNGNANFPADVVRNNLFELSRFYKTFGLEIVGHAVSVVSEILCNQVSRAKNDFLFDFFGDCFDGVNYRLIHRSLRGAPASHAYYCHCYIDEVHQRQISQTEYKGVNVVLSAMPLPSSVVRKFGLVNVFAS
ncbi:MAG: hypothetical protein Q8S55_21820 [Methylococcaceae bacterium]|jgi:hypothetical protein|nr:hypothetical protein [Methylococcaceae bacterium]